MIFFTAVDFENINLFSVVPYQVCTILKRVELIFPMGPTHVMRGGSM